MLCNFDSKFHFALPYGSQKTLCLMLIATVYPTVCPVKHFADKTKNFFSNNLFNALIFLESRTDTLRIKKRLGIETFQGLNGSRARARGCVVPEKLGAWIAPAAGSRRRARCGRCKRNRPR
jgi:hypothetical protein